MGLAEAPPRLSGYCWDRALGRFALNRRFNVDQVPCPYVFFGNSAVCGSAQERAQQRVKIKVPRKAQAQRQANLQLRFNAHPEAQPVR